MQTLTDVLLVLFLALGSAWFAADLVRKLRQPASSVGIEPSPAKLPPSPAPVVPPPASAPAPTATPAPAPATSPTPPPAPLAAPAPAAAVDGVPPAHFAVVAAVVHHLYKGRARVSAVVPAPLGAGTSPQIDWAREGRRDIFTSHRVR